MKVLYALFRGTCVLLLLTSALYGQGVGTSGDITGAVIDPSGAIVVKASVVALDTAKGFQRTAATDVSGHYRFSGLPPATYTVTVEGQGFAPEARSVTVALGETVNADFHLKLQGVTSQVEVTAIIADTTPLVDVERASQANTLDQQYINDLPIDRRDYLTFTLLMPGVSQSLNIADNRDLRLGRGQRRFREYRDQVRHQQVPWDGLQLFPQRHFGCTRSLCPDPGTDSRPAVFAHGPRPAGEEFTEPPAIWRSHRLSFEKGQDLHVHGV